MNLKVTDISDKTRGLAEKLKKNKWLLVGLAVGLVLLLIPWGGGGEQAQNQSMDVPSFALDKEEKKLEKALSKIDGVGEVSVILTLRSSIQQEAAWDDESNYESDADGAYTSNGRRTLVKVQSGSSSQSPVVLTYYYPEYRGALVIVEHLNASTKLEITDAVSALTGLSTDKVSVIQGN